MLHLSHFPLGDSAGRVHKLLGPLHRSVGKSPTGRILSFLFITAPVTESVGDSQLSSVRTVETLDLSHNLTRSEGSSSRGAKSIWGGDGDSDHVKEEDGDTDHRSDLRTDIAAANAVADIAISKSGEVLLLLPSFLFKYQFSADLLFSC